MTDNEKILKKENIRLQQQGTILHLQNLQLKQKLEQNNSWKTFAEEMPEEEKWILVKIAYSDSECEQMQLDEDFLKQDYYSGLVFDGIFTGGSCAMSFHKSVSDFTNEEWRYIE